MLSLMIRPETSRRSFLKAAAPFALGLGVITRAQIPVERGRFSEVDLPTARAQLLKQVNEERAGAGLSQLELDELACRVAHRHARDMVEHGFLSHWGSDGRKPYHRYSLAGGTDALQENVSSADGIQSVTAASVLNDLSAMHQSMLSEVAPNDGHRKTILYQRHTHVGFGIAMEGHSIRLDELYLARWVKIDPFPQVMATKTTLVLRGQLNLNHFLNGVEAFYEPLPTPPDINWLREPRSYGLPKESRRFLPHLPEGLTYPEGSHGDIDIDSSNRFRVRVPLSKQPGINTLLVWIKTGLPGIAFPGAQLCIRVEG
jgi:uncharacterized protein YkwD